MQGKAIRTRATAQYGIFLSAIVLLAAGFVVVHEYRKPALAQGSSSLQGAIPLTLIDANLELNTYAESGTVASVLAKLGIQYSEHDFVTPPLDQNVAYGTNIIITRSNAIRVNDGGTTEEHETQVALVSELLDQLGKTLGPKDRLDPAPGTFLVPSMTVTITRVTEEEKKEEESISFETQTKDDASMLRGQTVVDQEGKSGKREKIFHVIMENGREVSRELLSEKVLEEPVTKVVRRGTKELIGDVVSGNASWYRNGGGMTTAARDWPRGTRLRVTNRENGRVVIVTVVGWGPQPSTGRVLDLGADAFATLSTLGDGVIPVKVEQLL